MIAIKIKIKSWLGPLWWWSLVIFFTQRFGDVINIYVGLWLVPKYVSSNELGALLPLTQIAGLLGLPFAIILTPFGKFINTFGAKEEYGKIKALLLDVLILVGIGSVIIGIYTWHAAPLIFERLRIGSSSLVWILCGITVTSLVLPLTNNALAALKNFRVLSFAGLISAPLRLGALFLLLPLFGLSGYFSSQLALNICSGVIAFWGLRKLVSSETKRESYYSHWREMVAYTLPFVIMTGVGAVSSSIQYLVIRQRLLDVESAAFYFCSRFAEIPNMVWYSIGCVFFPYISDAFERGKDTRQMLYKVFTVTVVGGGAIALLLGLSMSWVFGLVGQWANYRPYAYLVGWLALTNVFSIGGTCIIVHEMACRRFSFLWYTAPIALIESAFFISFTGYGFFTPYLPASWVDWMASLRVARLEYIIGVHLLVALLVFCLLFLQFYFNHALKSKIQKPSADN